MAVENTAFFIGELMTVQVTDRLSQLYVGNGVNTRFDFTFRIFDQEDETGVAVRVKVGNEFEFLDETKYTVSINPDNLGGYVNFLDAPDAQTFFYIAGKTPVDQLLDITNYDNFYPDAIERALDKLTAILQEWKHLVDFETQARILADLNYDELAQQREAELRAYIDGIASAITGQPVLGLPAKFVVDQTGKTQQQLNDASIYTVGSVAEMLTLNSYYRSRTIRIKATGAMYIYDESQAAVNDGFYTLNGWILVGFHDRLVAKTAGLKGDGTNEFTKIKSLFDVASALDMPVHMCGLKVSTSNLVASGNLKLIGTGGIKLFAGSQGTLLNTAYNLIVHGEIEFDQNKANNAGGVIGAETHCAIKHSGDILDLKGAKFKPSTSINVVTRAVKKVTCEDIEVDGGMIGLYAIPGINAKVEVLRGEYMNAHQYDNIQILNGSDIIVEGVKSHDSTRSCIVVSNYTAKARIYGNTAYGAKVDAANQGGWGIIASVKSQDSIVTLNNCFGNQRGPMTIDVYPDSGAGVDNRIVVSGNICNADYNGNYGTSGIVLNDTKHANVFGNIITRAAQGMVCVDADYSNIHGNTFIDCRDYFLTAVTSHNLVFSGKNLCDGCPVTGAAAIRFLDCNQFHSGNNIIRNLTGAAPFIYRVSGNSKDWTIEAEDCIKAGAGTGYMFHIIGAGNTGGRIIRNRIKAPGVKGFDWYIASDNLAQFSSFDNEIDSVGTGYITSGANTVTAGDDKFNGSKNFFAAAPTTFKSMIGQHATIGGVQKVWNGSAWA